MCLRESGGAWRRMWMLEGEWGCLKENGMFEGEWGYLRENGDA